jgi:hypothetical protein
MALVGGSYLFIEETLLSLRFSRVKRGSAKFSNWGFKSLAVIVNSSFTCIDAKLVLGFANFILL